MGPSLSLTFLVARPQWWLPAWGRRCIPGGRLVGSVVIDVGPGALSPACGCRLAAATETPPRQTMADLVFFVSDRRAAGGAG
jgi:hypothetical protein